MTATVQRTAREVVTDWLSDFETALTAGDVESAAGLFRDDSYWRDLIAFTWNIVTVEGPGGVRDMLSSTLDRVRPHGFAVADRLGEPTRDGGVTESWIQFETSIGRCLGQLRLKDGQAWTLLTTMFELKGHEEPLSERRSASATFWLLPASGPGSRTPNSSPPSRATVAAPSEGLTSAIIRAIAWSSRSPASWPSASFVALSPSTSASTTPTEPARVV